MLTTDTFPFMPEPSAADADYSTNKAFPPDQASLFSFVEQMGDTAVSPVMQPGMMKRPSDPFETLRIFSAGQEPGVDEWACMQPLHDDFNEPPYSQFTPKETSTQHGLREAVLSHFKGPQEPLSSHEPQELLPHAKDFSVREHDFVKDSYLKDFSAKDSYLKDSAKDFYLKDSIKDSLYFKDFSAKDFGHETPEAEFLNAQVPGNAKETSLLSSQHAVPSMAQTHVYSMEYPRFPTVEAESGSEEPSRPAGRTGLEPWPPRSTSRGQPPTEGTEHGAGAVTRPSGTKAVRARAAPTPRIKLHRCPVCLKNFKRPSSFRIHFTTHTGVKSFTCEWEGCGKRFNVKSNMTRHQKLHTRQAK